MVQFASFWYGQPLSAYEHLCISSFIKAGHSFDLFSYDLEINAPDGCKVRSASEIYPKDKIFFYNEMPTPKVSAFSNMFRYRLVYETGCCWVDTDVLCLNASLSLLESEILFARQDAQFHNVAVLRFPAGHEAMRLAAEYCWERRNVSRFGDLGPGLFTQVVAEYGLEEWSRPSSTLYPVHYLESAALFDPQRLDWVLEQISQSDMLHLWNETFDRIGFDKIHRPPPGSYLATVLEEAGLLGLFGSGDGDRSA
ncbi:hypothetical protein [Kaistia terrae]|uniref:Alpha 1,4-glycosyltransferase domain-containing protein n=1 Tax=Kaistia terrae TaxID=537017 RepID=A0ABW0PZR3_9HYPH|nr:hypothetical protein [Kaistia terrae]MCX5578959.1 hypothetical protein [Kaistia terrae]